MTTTGDLPILVIGLDPVGQAIVHRLHALRVPVRVALTPADRLRHGAMLEALGVDTLEVGEVWQNDFAKLELSRHGAVVLAGDDDAENVDACLVARRCCGEVPIAVRVSDQTLVRFLRMTAWRDYRYPDLTPLNLVKKAAALLIGEHRVARIKRRLGVARR